MKFKKAIALILAAQMMTACLAACDTSGGDETDAPVETSAPETSAPETAAPETAAPETAAPETEAPAVNELTFNGQEFRILCGSGFESQYQYNEDALGDVLNDALWARNSAVESKHDAKIVAVPTSSDFDSFELVLSYAQSGEDAYDVVDLKQYQSWYAVVTGALRNWNDVPGLKLDNPWWNVESNADSTIAGKVYTLIGDLSLTSLQFSWILGFNAELMEDWGWSSEALYNLVKDGEWTVDKMIEILGEMYLDTDGVDGVTAGDTYGYMQILTNSTDQWVTAIDARMLTKNDDGSIEVTLGSEKVYSTLEKLVNFFYAAPGVFEFPWDAAEQPSFLSGNIGMTYSILSGVESWGESADFEYGILPYPKYDAAQEVYLTAAMDQLSVYGTPVTVPEDRLEFVGVMMESLNEESYKSVTPAYLDKVLKGRYSTDENMATVVDMIVQNRYFDMAYQYSGHFAKLPYQFRYCISGNTTDLASKLAENKEIMDAAIVSLNEFYENGTLISLD